MWLSTWLVFHVSLLLLMLFFNARTMWLVQLKMFSNLFELLKCLFRKISTDMKKRHDRLAKATRKRYNSFRQKTMMTALFLTYQCIVQMTVYISGLCYMFPNICKEIVLNPNPLRFQAWIFSIFQSSQRDLASCHLSSFSVCSSLTAPLHFIDVRSSQEAL